MTKLDIKFIEWILRKFHLPSIREFISDVGWNKTTIKNWKKSGTPKALTTIIQDKLIIIKIMGKVSCEQSVNLDDLFKEYKNLKEK